MSRRSTAGRDLSITYLRRSPDSNVDQILELIGVLSEECIERP